MSDIKFNASDVDFIFSRSLLPSTKHMKGCRCHAYCNLPRLPLEIWLRILKIKKWTDRKLILEQMFKNRETHSGTISYWLVYIDNIDNQYIHVLGYTLRSVDYFYCTSNMPMNVQSRIEIIEDATGIEDPKNEGHWHYCPILDFAYWSYKWDRINFYFNKDW